MQYHRCHPSLIVMHTGRVPFTFQSRSISHWITLTDTLLLIFLLCVAELWSLDFIIVGTLEHELWRTDWATSNYSVDYVVKRAGGCALSTLAIYVLRLPVLRKQVLNAVTTLLPLPLDSNLAQFPGDDFINMLVPSRCSWPCTLSVPQIFSRAFDSASVQFTAIFSTFALEANRFQLTSRGELGLNRFAPNRFQCEHAKSVSNRFGTSLACPCEHPQCHRGCIKHAASCQHLNIVTLETSRSDEISVYEDDSECKCSSWSCDITKHGLPLPELCSIETW